MQLQPRRFVQTKEWEGRLAETYGQPGSIHRFKPESAGSIWCMVLPNTSYTAPEAAFWWVSNEVRR